MNVVVMRIRALDVDLINSDNWLAVFNIVSGNEEGLFTIHTDPKTNEGILMLVKVGLLCSISILCSNLYLYVYNDNDYVYVF